MTGMLSRSLFTLLLWMIAFQIYAEGVIHGAVFFLNSGSQPAAGVDVSAFGANTVQTTDQGMFVLRFPDKKPGDRVKIIIGSKDRKGTSLELVNDKVVAEARIPSRPEDDILEVIVCRVGHRNEAALRYNGIIVKTVNDNYEKNLRDINQKLEAQHIDAKTIVSLQREKEKLAAERDSAIAKAEEQALFIASINLDKASEMVKIAINKVDSLQDIAGAIKVLDSERLYQAYLEASEKKKKAVSEINQVIDGFLFKVKLLEPTYRYSEIADIYEKISGIYQNEFDDPDAIIKYLIFAGDYWSKHGNYQKQLELTQKAFSICEIKFPDGYPRKSRLYYELATSYLNIGDLKQAEEYMIKGFELDKVNLKDDDPRWKGIYNQIGKIYSITGNHKKALEYKLKKLSLEEKIQPCDSTDLATAYNNVAVTYGELGDFDNQLHYNLKAMQIKEKILPADHPSLATSYYNLAATYYNRLDYQSALAYNLKTLAIDEKVLHAKHPDLAWSYSDLARTYVALGQSQKGIDYFKKALIIREQVLPSNHMDIGLNYANIGFAYFELKDYALSLENLFKALTIYEKTLPADHDDWGQLYLFMGRTYAALKKFQEALDVLLKASANFEHNFGANHPKLAEVYVRIGNANRGLGAYQNALDYYTKALNIYEKSAKPQALHIATVLNNLANTFMELGEIEQAIVYGNRAVHMADTMTPPYDLRYLFYAGLGMAYVKANQYEIAKTYFEKSAGLETSEKLYRGWAMYYAQQGKTQQAIENLRKAVEMDFKDVRWIKTDGSLDNIRSEPGYKEIVDQLEKQ